MRWLYQERWTEWTMWGLGWTRTHGRGWKYDELTIFIGPLRLVFLGEENAQA